MTSNEIYEFDRTGYLVISDMLTNPEVKELAAAVDEIEAHALANVANPPHFDAPWGMTYHRNTERGYHARGEKGEGKTLIVEDFWNASPAFDLLLQHEKTNAYVSSLITGRFTINNSEIRYRYHGNATQTHMGGPIDPKYRYAFSAGKPDCMMVRMIYFVHDVPLASGPFCVVPGTHKTNLKSPYPDNPAEEPGMIGLEAKAGDAILFTENLRHGGLINQSHPRKTLHVGYGPYWMMSQNIATMDQPQHITQSTRSRLSPKQRALFEPWPR